MLEAVALVANSVLSLITLLVVIFWRPHDAPPLPIVQQQPGSTAIQPRPRKITFRAVPVFPTMDILTLDNIEDYSDRCHYPLSEAFLRKKKRAFRSALEILMMFREDVEKLTTIDDFDRSTCNWRYYCGRIGGFHIVRPILRYYAVIFNHENMGRGVMLRVEAESERSHYLTLVISSTD